MTGNIDVSRSLLIVTSDTPISPDNPISSGRTTDTAIAVSRAELGVVGMLLFAELKKVSVFVPPPEK
jgi:hypothetical protein